MDECPKTKRSVETAWEKKGVWNLKFSQEMMSTEPGGMQGQAHAGPWVPWCGGCTSFSR